MLSDIPSERPPLDEMKVLLERSLPIPKFAVQTKSLTFRQEKHGNVVTTVTQEITKVTIPKSKLHTPTKQRPPETALPPRRKRSLSRTPVSQDMSKRVCQHDTVY